MPTSDVGAYHYFYYPHLFFHAVDGVVDPVQPERSGLNEAAYNYSMRKMWVIESYPYRLRFCFWACCNTRFWWAREARRIH